MARSSRNDYRKRRRRKRRRKALASLFAVCVISGAVIAAITVFFKVGGIEVSGSSLYKPEDIIAASEIQIGDNMFAINKFDIANKILKDFPYVGEIKIRRRLPDTFTFEITERKRAAFFQREKFRWLIDKNGYILESVAPDQAVSAPMVVGLTLMAPTPGTKIAISETDSLYPLTALLTALESGGMIEKTGQIDVRKLYNLTVTYDNRFIIEFGTQEELDKKIRMLTAVLKQLEPTDKGTINVSDVKQARFRPNANINLNLAQNNAPPENAQAPQNAETPQTQAAAGEETKPDDSTEQDKAEDKTETEDTQGNG